MRNLYNSKVKTLRIFGSHGGNAAFLLAVLLFVSILIALAGCKAVSAPYDKDSGDHSQDAISVVATTFPLYDWAKNVAGEYAEKRDVAVDIIIDSGVDPHSFQPSVDDVAKIADADVFIYVGGESDEWVSDAHSEIKRERPDGGPVAVDLMKILGDKSLEEETVEGMEIEENDDAGDEDEEADEHVWMSIRSAEIFVKKIADALCKVDTNNADQYQKNADTYIKKLKSLDSEYKNIIDSGEKKTIIVADRFPFRYLVNDYGIDYYAAFAGCSSETGASFETISFLAGKTDALGIGTIFRIDGSEGDIAKAVKDASKKHDQKIEMLDSMQSVSKDDIKGGKTYIGTMKDNLKTLERALG